MKIRIWMTFINTKHGISVYPFDNPDKAFGAVIEFVNDWWETEMHGTPKPKDPETMVDDYFEFMESESYEIVDSILELTDVKES